MINGCLSYPATRVLNPILQMRKSRLRDIHHLLGRATPVLVVMRMGQGQVGQWMPWRYGNLACHSGLLLLTAATRTSLTPPQNESCRTPQCAEGLPREQKGLAEVKVERSRQGLHFPGSMQDPTVLQTSPRRSTSHRASLISTGPAWVPGLPLLGPMVVAFTTSSEPDMGRGQRR